MDFSCMEKVLNDLTKSITFNNFGYPTTENQSTLTRWQHFFEKYYFKG